MQPTSTGVNKECLAVLIASLCITILAVIGMMVVFLGAGGPDSRALSQTLGLATPVLSLWMVASWLRGWAVRWWQRLPAWAWVAGLTVWVIAALALLALLMMGRISGEPVPPIDYLPIAAALIATLAFTIALAQIAPQKARRYSASPPTEPGAS